MIHICLPIGNNGEDDVFKGVVRWLEHDVTERIDCFKDMLKLVKLIHVSSPVINELKQMMCMQENLGKLIWLVDIQMSCTVYFVISLMIDQFVHYLPYVRPVRGLFLLSLISFSVISLSLISYRDTNVSPLC